MHPILRGGVGGLTTRSSLPRRAVRVFRRIPDAGGTPRILTVLNLQKGEAAHVWPEILPGGQVVLFTVLARLRPQNDIAVQSLETGERRGVLEGGNVAVNIQGSNLDVWIYGVGHNAVTRLTFEKGTASRRSGRRTVNE